MNEDRLTLRINVTTSVTWIRGSHTANIHGYAKKPIHAHDAFTFAWEKDWPTEEDFRSALNSYLGDI